MNTNEMLLSAQPTFLNNNLLFLREEKGDYLTITPKAHPEVQYLEINPIARHIINVANGNNSIKNIVDSLLEKYDGVSFDIALGDVINLMHNLWRLKLIKWSDYNPIKSLYSENLDNYTFKLLQEDDVVTNINSIYSNINYINPYFVDDISYTEIALRQKTYSFIEAFFVISDGQKDLFIISFLPILYKSKTLRIGVAHFYSEELIPLDIMKKLLLWASKKISFFIKGIIDIEFSRVDFCNYFNITNKLFLKKMINYGFGYVGELKNELNNNNTIELYSFKI